MIVFVLVSPTLHLSCIQMCLHQGNVGSPPQEKRSSADVAESYQSQEEIPGKPEPKEDLPEKEPSNWNKMTEVDKQKTDPYHF